MPALSFELRDCQAWRDAGLPISTTSNECAKLYDAAVSQMFGWTSDETIGGTGGAIKAMLEADQNFVLGQVLDCSLDITFSGGLGLSKMEATRKKAQAVINCAEKNDINDREKRYVEALKHLLKGNNVDACQAWDDILVTYPTDRMALHMTNQTYLHAGEMERLRNAAARVLPFWKKHMRQYGYVLGWLGFGHEETRNYTEGERFGKMAIDLERTDCWARHCLAHVYEMTGRPDVGIQNLSSSEKDWSSTGVIVGHNYWHWSLFYVEKREYEEALGIFDTKFQGSNSRGSTDWLDFIDSSSLLQRLQFEGVDASSRWDDLYEKARPHLDDPEHIWSFIDAHLMFPACHSPKNTDISKKFLESAKKYVREQSGLNKQTMQIIGVPLLESMQEYQEGNYEKVVDLLYPVRYEMWRLGGSEAQRDVFHLFLINAAMKSTKYQNLARSLIAERMSLKEDSALNERWMARAVAAH